MSELSQGFPRQKGPKPKKFGSMSAKTTAKIPERQAVVEEVHRRSGGRCEAAHIAPGVRCSVGLDSHEMASRGRKPGSQYDSEAQISICRKCHTVVGLEVKASEILGLLGEQGRLKHTPISEDDLVWAKEQFRKAKERLAF
jgi:hypothetical protein